MAISTIGTDALASSAVTSAKLASGAPSRAQLPAGTVLQVVQQSASGTTTVNNTSTYGSTGLAATITPTSASSKILVLISTSLFIQKGSPNDFGCGFAIYRNGSSVFADTNSYDTIYVGPNGFTLNNFRGRVSTQYLDSPATTSSCTYTLYVNAYQGQTSMNSNGSLSYITLMEIAA